MNPLDLLAEVAVSCSDEDKCENPKHSVGFVEAEEYCIGTTVPSECKLLRTVNNNLCEITPVAKPEPLETGTVTQKCFDIVTCIDEQLVCEGDTEIREEYGLSTTPRTKYEHVTADAWTLSGSVVEKMDKQQPLSQSPSLSNEAVPPSQDLPIIERTISMPAIMALSDEIQTSKVAISALPKKPAMCISSKTHPPLPVLSSTVSQRVTRLLSPNFKLTMTDSIPHLIHSRKVSSLLIGNMGSATLQHSPAPISPAAAAVPSIPTKNRIAVRKYPNISMPAIPTDYPLLDHDYCYRNYCDIVQAATKLLKEKAAEKKAAVKLLVKTVEEEGKPIKRKYRTKRIIAEELERRTILTQKASDGDTDAQEELKSLADEELLLREMKQRKKSLKRKPDQDSPVTPPPEVDSEDEAWNEMMEDGDDSSRVTDHDSNFQDKYVYFGSKKYKSRRRHLDKKEDPYSSFWKSGRLNEGQAGAKAKNSVDAALSASKSLQGEFDSSSEGMARGVNQEMDDVLDVLGLSPCNSIGVGADEANGMDPLGQADAVYSDSSPSNESLNTNIDRSCSDSNGTARPTGSRKRTHSQTITPPPSAASQSGDVCESAETNVYTVHDNIASDEIVDDGLGDLLRGLTMDQVSQLLVSLDVEPSLDTVSDTLPASTVGPEAANTLVKSLVMLARSVCLENNIDLPSDISQTEADISKQGVSQLSQGTNISLDITDADLLVTDKNLNLDILQGLSATPPRPTRPSSLFQTPTTSSSTCSNLSMNITDSPTSETPVDLPSQSPVVVPVTMYWNTFPALLLDGVKYVRLMDICRQALPSKETGLLKKRAQSLGYEVITCTELQRNLLVRYAFACPSRSSLMVCEAGAAEVIASYMEKSEIEELSMAPTLPFQQMPVNVTSTTTTNVQAPAEPIIMPQTLVEHKPLQQSNSGNGRKTPTTNEAVAPERSSRLRQVKSSYRRFLRAGSITGTSSSPAKAVETTAALVAAVGNVIEENASDRGYHSDQSPDPLTDKPVKPIKAKKPRNTTAEKKPTKTSKVINKPVSTASVMAEPVAAAQPEVECVEVTDKAVTSTIKPTCDVDAEIQHVKVVLSDERVRDSAVCDVDVEIQRVRVKAACDVAAEEINDIQVALNDVQGKVKAACDAEEQMMDDVKLVLTDVKANAACDTEEKVMDDVKVLLKDVKDKAACDAEEEMQHVKVMLTDVQVKCDSTMDKPETQHSSLHSDSVENPCVVLMRDERYLEEPAVKPLLSIDDLVISPELPIARASPSPSASNVPVAEPLLNVSTKSEIVYLRHIGLKPKKTGVNHAQDGKMYLSFFSSLFSPCIECCSCSQFYSLKSFLKHQHYIGSKKELLELKVRRQIVPRGVSVNCKLWKKFKKMRELYVKAKPARTPLQKLNPTKISKIIPAATNTNYVVTSPSDLSPTPLLGKRVPKQKVFNPDEFCYTDTLIVKSRRKRKCREDEY